MEAYKPSMLPAPYTDMLQLRADERDYLVKLNRAFKSIPPQPPQNLTEVGYTVLKECALKIYDRIKEFIA